MALRHTTERNRTMATLNELMEFDHPVYVSADGTVADPPCPLYAPELFGIDDNELQSQARSAGWAGLLTGYTGQYGYNGPVMHPSEYVGGGLERYILATPGWYVVTAVMDDEDYEPYGWAIAYLPTEH